MNDPQKRSELQTVARQVWESLMEQKLADENLPDETLVMQLPELAEGEVSRRDEPELETGGVAEVAEPDESVSEPVQEAEEVVVVEDPAEAVQEADVTEPAEETVNAVSGGDAQETVAVETEPVYTSYLIKKGDTLIKICMDRYGSLEQLALICNINGITNPDSIEVGQIILLP